MFCALLMNFFSASPSSIFSGAGSGTNMPARQAGLSFIWPSHRSRCGKPSREMPDHRYVRTQHQLAISAMEKSPAIHSLSFNPVSSTSNRRRHSCWYRSIAGWIFSGKYLKKTLACPIIGPMPPIWNISHCITSKATIFCQWRADGRLRRDAGYILTGTASPVVPWLH